MRNVERQVHWQKAQMQVRWTKSFRHYLHRNLWQAYHTVVHELEEEAGHPCYKQMTAGTDEVARRRMDSGSWLCQGDLCHDLWNVLEIPVVQNLYVVLETHVMLGILETLDLYLNREHNDASVSKPSCTASKHSSVVEKGIRTRGIVSFPCLL